MTRTHRFARSSALPAIAAALALSSTTAVAQQADPQTSLEQPAPTDTAPAVSAAPAPALEATPAPADTANTAASTAEIAPASTTMFTKTKPSRKVAAAGPVVTHAVVQKTTRTTHATAPVAAASVAAAAAPPAPPAQSQSAVKPIAHTSAAPAPVAGRTAAEPARATDNGTAVELGAGALAIIALGAGAYAMTRRRRTEDDIVGDTYAPEPEQTVAEEAVLHHEPLVEPEPMADTDPAMIAPEASAFAWGNRTHVDAREEAKAQQRSDDREEGESWVERAYRGPSPENPSLSLKTRLKRAAFFDKRERDVAEGKAVPVDAEAGLPDAAVEDMREREFETA